MAEKEILYTFDRKLLSYKFVKKPQIGKELKFPRNLEKWYKKSLRLRI